MSCKVLTQEVLERTLAGRLDAGERERLAEHLAGPCEECLDLLASADSDRLLAALAGDDCSLSPQESERIFRAALAGRERQAPPAPSGWWWAAFPRWALAASAAAVVALVVAFFSFKKDDGAGRWTGVKGGGVEHAEMGVRLLAFVVESEGSSARTRRFSDGEALRAGEFLAFRFRLDTPAFLYLVRLEPGEILWQSDPGGQKPATGEGEIGASGKALALPCASIPAGATLALVASPGPLRQSDLESHVQAGEFAQSLSSWCPGCTVDVLHLAPRGER